MSLNSLRSRGGSPAPRTLPTARPPSSRETLAQRPQRRGQSRASWRGSLTASPPPALAAAPPPRWTWTPSSPRPTRGSCATGRRARAPPPGAVRAALVQGDAGRPRRRARGGRAAGRRAAGAAALTSHFSSSCFTKSAASITVRLLSSSTILSRSAIVLSFVIGRLVALPAGRISVRRLRPDDLLLSHSPPPPGGDEILFIYSPLSTRA
mgnify:CR=1 FL=1